MYICYNLYASVYGPLDIMNVAGYPVVPCHYPYYCWLHVGCTGGYLVGLVSVSKVLNIPLTHACINIAGYPDA
jgi:hypothetical protein